MVGYNENNVLKLHDFYNIKLGTVSRDPACQLSIWVCRTLYSWTCTLSCSSGLSRRGWVTWVVVSCRSWEAAEEGIDSRGLFDDIKDVVKLAKDMGLDDNESFFSKVKMRINTY